MVGSPWFIGVRQIMVGSEPIGWNMSASILTFAVI